MRTSLQDCPKRLNGIRVSIAANIPNLMVDRFMFSEFFEGYVSRELICHKGAVFDVATRPNKRTNLLRIKILLLYYLGPDIAIALNHPNNRGLVSPTASFMLVTWVFFPRFSADVGLSISTIPVSNSLC